MLRFRDYSIPRKLTLMNMLISSTVLLLASAGFFFYDMYNFRRRIVRDLGIQAQIIGSNSISAVTFDDNHSAENTLSALRAAPHVMFAEIYTPDSHAFAGYRRDRNGPFPPPPAIPAGSAEAHLFQGDLVVLVKLMSFQGKPVATIYIGSDLQTMNDLRKNFALIVAGVFVMSLFATIWMSSVARRSIAEPIVRLAETAGIILSERDYSVRASPVDELSEVSVLISTFNEMLAQIQERDAALGEARDRLEQQVQQRTAQLKAANADLEAFSYSVSHDLRAPLRHISAFSRILSEEHDTKLDPDARHLLSRIQNGVTSMSGLVDGLLRMAQVGRKELACVATDLNVLLKDAVADLQPECDGRHVDWNIGNLSLVDCDPGLMKQVFVNLISNALKYTRRREIARIDVGQLEQDGMLVIFVRDNGAGFDERYADKLFGVFQRLHSVEEFEGNGVGLSTVDRIIKKHGGEIWAKAQVDEGATFYFTLSPTGTALTGATRVAVAAAR